MVDFAKYWVELSAGILLFLGFIFSLLAGSAVLSYCIVVLAGMIGGRVIYKNKSNQVFPWILITVGFSILLF